MKTRIASICRWFNNLTGSTATPTLRRGVVGGREPLEPRKYVECRSQKKKYPFDFLQTSQDWLMALDM